MRRSTQSLYLASQSIAQAAGPTKRSVLKSLALTMLLGALTACAGGPTTIKGRVVDHRGAPVAKAVIQTEPATDTVFTTNRGFFVLRQRLNDLGDAEPILPGDYKIRVNKSGFEDQAAEVTVEGGPTQITDLVMQPRTLDVGEAAPEELQEREVSPGDTSVPIQGN
jgi:hypothetical protein